MKARHLSGLFLCGVLQGSFVAEGKPRTAAYPQNTPQKEPSTSWALERLDQKDTLLEERFNNKMERLESALKESLLAEREAMFYDNIKTVGILMTLISGVLFGSGAWSLKTAKEKFEKDLQTAKDEFNTLSTQRAQELSNIADILRAEAKHESDEIRRYTNNMSNRILDRSTATMYSLRHIN